MAGKMMRCFSSQTNKDSITAEVDPAYSWSGVAAIDYDNAKSEIELIGALDKLIARFIELYE